MSQDELPEDEVALAQQLVQSGTGQERITPGDFEESTQFGSMSAPAKVEFYSRKLQTAKSELIDQITAERDRLLVEKKAFTTDRDEFLRCAKELVSLKSCLVRDRWETVVSVCAAAAGGGLVGTESWKGCGWALIVIAGVWQGGKTLWVTIVDWLYKDR